MNDSMKFEEGIVLLEAGRFGDAAECFRAAAEEKTVRPKERVQALLGAARALISGGQTEEAEAILDKMSCREERPLHEDLMPFFFHEKARVAAQSGRTDEAVKLFREELIALASTMPHYFPRLSDNFAEQAALFLEQGDMEQTSIFLRLARDYAETADSESAIRRVLSLESIYLERQGDLKLALAKAREARDLYLKTGRRADAAGEERRIAGLNKSLSFNQYQGKRDEH